jgi:hypothetical protein
MSGGLRRTLPVFARFDAPAGYLDALCRGRLRSGEQSERLFCIEARS